MDWRRRCDRRNGERDGQRYRCRGERPRDVVAEGASTTPVTTNRPENASRAPSATGDDAIAAGSSKDASSVEEGAPVREESDNSDSEVIDYIERQDRVCN